MFTRVARCDKPRALDAVLARPLPRCGRHRRSTRGDFALASFIRLRSWEPPENTESSCETKRPNTSLSHESAHAGYDTLLLSKASLIILAMLMSRRFSSVSNATMVRRPVEGSWSRRGPTLLDRELPTVDHRPGVGKWFGGQLASQYVALDDDGQTDRVVRSSLVVHCCNDALVVANVRCPVDMSLTSMTLSSCFASVSSLLSLTSVREPCRRERGQLENE